MKAQKTTIAKTPKRIWHQVNAGALPMGRVATIIANLLRGKHKRDFTPHMDMGDFVVATNVDKFKFSGRKLEQKKYYTHSGYLGGLKTKRLKDLNQSRPEEVLKKAVINMLDDLKFRKSIMARLKLVKGDSHTFNIDKIW